MRLVWVRKTGEGGVEEEGESKRGQRMRRRESEKRIGRREGRREGANARGGHSAGRKRVLLQHEEAFVSPAAAAGHSHVLSGSTCWSTIQVCTQVLGWGGGLHPLQQQQKFLIP